MTQAERFEQLRPLLRAIAYRILGSVADADDAVQETWIRFARDPSEPRSLRPYLATIVTRVSITQLESAQRRREVYPGPWFPEPLLDEPYEEPARAAELADSISIATLVLLERLSPLERAVFVLREAFGFSFAEIAEAVERSEAAVRQLAVRAREHVGQDRARFEVRAADRDRLARRFFAAFRAGEVAQLRDTLAADARLSSDGGGKAPALPRAVEGSDAVARLLASVALGYDAIGMRIEETRLNGMPGAIVRDADGAVLHVVLLEFDARGITAVRTIINPEKLAHLGAVADARGLSARFRAAVRSLRSRTADGG